MEQPAKEKKPDITARFWHRELSEAKKWHREFYTRGKKVVQRYKDERKDNPIAPQRRFNILWSNTETLKPALYAKTPVPEVGRRFKDNDPVAREASTVLDRALTTCLDLYDFDNVMRTCLQDYLLPARAQAWVEYEPVIANDDDGEYLEDERTKTCYINYQDFLHNPARTWDEVNWVGRKAYFTRGEVKKKPEWEKHADKINYDHKPDDLQDDDPVAGEYKKACVWEIWSKKHNKVFFIAEGYKDFPLEVKDPPVKFKGFFPCPRPLIGTHSSDKFLPVPDFVQYQDQADELDDLTAKKHTLMEALKVVGVYDSTASGLEKMLQDGFDNQLIPVDNWAMFAQKGGIQGSVQFFPLKEIAEALIRVYEAIDRIKADIYEITGLSDIIRGASDARETAEAQKIKSQWGSIRVRDRQHEIQRFARDIIRLKAEVIAEQFDIETLKSISGVQLPTRQEVEMQAMQAQMMAQQQGQQPPQPPKQVTWEDVFELLRNDRMRTFRVDIETDSTIYADEQAEKQARTEFISQVTQFLQVSGEIVAQSPTLAPMLGEFLMFAVRAFRVGSQLEDIIEETMEKVKQEASQPRPDPAAEAAKMEAEINKAELQLKGEEIQNERAQMQQEGQLAQADNALEAEKLQVEKAKVIAEATNPMVSL